MKNKKPNAELVWKQLEDLLAPRLRLSVFDRTVYSHLLRHSRLEGKLRLRFSILGLARNLRLSPATIREGVRRLIAHGALRLLQRSKAGHLVEVRLPGEIRAVRLSRIESRATAKREHVSAHPAPTRSTSRPRPSRRPPPGHARRSPRGDRQSPSPQRLPVTSFQKPYTRLSSQHPVRGHDGTLQTDPGCCTHDLPCSMLACDRRGL